MMNNRFSPLFFFFPSMAFLLHAELVIATKPCGACVRTPVPYPLSTSPNCGDQSYKIRCNGGKLWFDAVNGSLYMITSINPATQRLIIRPPDLINKTCVSSDYANGGFLLDTSMPFNVTSSNTVFFMNCSKKEYESSCSSSDVTNICYKYISGNSMAARACGASGGASAICCTIKTGGSSTAYWVKRAECTSYQSFPYLDGSTLPISKWPEPGLELEWKLPREPSCKLPIDCQDLVNSACLPDPAGGGTRRCLCKPGFQWDAINGMCQQLRCRHGRHCNLHKKKFPLIGGMACVGGILFLGSMIGAYIYKKKQRTKREAQLNLKRVREHILNANNSGKLAKVYAGKEIAKATNNFNNDNLLGAGGFGEVFKGTLNDGTIVAVKRAKVGCTKGIDQILNEVRVLCQVNHRSLVRLLGCCVELNQPLLIYEYVPNGTLFDHLHGHKTEKLEPISWQHRLQIAHQAAEGLAYLHFSAIPRIYHRDIKSSNILLDHERNAKVADFGLSRLAVSEASHITTCAQGTLGYLDPDYYMNFQLTDKSDVYSFGVVLLELLTSKKAIDFNREEEDVNLVVFIKRALKEEMFTDVIDPVLKEGARKVDLETMKALGSLAIACLDGTRENRPSMKQVAEEIEYIISITNQTLN